MNLRPPSPQPEGKSRMSLTSSQGPSTHRLFPGFDSILSLFGAQRGHDPEAKLDESTPTQDFRSGPARTRTWI
jgi:hypothetical protein